jgi:nitrate/nitrite transporter NarK
METVFFLSNLAVMPFWLLMIFAPTWSVTRNIIRSMWVLLPMPLLYAVLVVVLAPQIGEVFRALSQPTLPDIEHLFSRQEIACLAWIHFLAFDFFVGRWIYLDSREKGRNVWLMVPVLFLTLMLGPIGLLSYLGISAWKR